MKNFIENNYGGSHAIVMKNPFGVTTYLSSHLKVSVTDYGEIKCYLDDEVIPLSRFILICRRNYFRLGQMSNAIGNADIPILYITADKGFIIGRRTKFGTAYTIWKSLARFIALTNVEKHYRLEMYNYIRKDHLMKFSQMLEDEYYNSIAA